MINKKNVHYCEECGAKYTRLTNDKTCSEECSKNRRNRMRTREYENSIGVEKKCVICDNTFKTQNESREVCSRECEAIRARNYARKQFNISDTTICKHCGTEFEKDHRKAFCSENCRMEYTREYNRIKQRESRARRRRVGR